MIAPDPSETTQVRDSAEHWDALAQRIAATAVRASRPGGVDWLARSRAGWVAASLLLAVGLWLASLPPETSSPARVRDEWAGLLAPPDDVGQAIVARDGPPSIGALLLSGQSRSGQGR
jgi:hypothetical protein